MPNIFLSANLTREKVRLQREILATLRVEFPNSPQGAALKKLVSNTLSSLTSAGIKDGDLMRVTLIIARKYIREFQPSGGDEWHINTRLSS